MAKNWHCCVLIFSVFVQNLAVTITKTETRIPKLSDYVVYVLTC